MLLTRPVKIAAERNCPVASTDERMPSSSHEEQDGRTIVLYPSMIMDEESRMGQNAALRYVLRPFPKVQLVLCVRGKSGVLIERFYGKLLR